MTVKMLRDAMVALDVRTNRLGGGACLPGVGEYRESKRNHVATIVFARLHIPDPYK